MIGLDAATADAPWIEVKGASVTWERTKNHAGGGGCGGGSGGGAGASTLPNEADPSMVHAKLEIRNLSLSVRAGELLLVAGPVGSGKSTLLAALARTLCVPPSMQRFYIDTKPPRPKPGVCSSI
jgi:ABC-type multidrug transport system fused ATPase/permease subunit